MRTAHLSGSLGRREGACLPLGPEGYLPPDPVVGGVPASASGGVYHTPFTTHPLSPHHHPREQKESQTGVKTLPSRNFVCWW